MISYEVVGLEPFSIEECNVGSGAACGAVFLNKGFEDLLREKLGGRAESILTSKRLAEAVRFFESSIKVAFNPYDEYTEDEFDVPMGAIERCSRDWPRRRVFEIVEVHWCYDDFNGVRDDIEGIFQPIFDQIYDLIRSTNS